MSGSFLIQLLLQGSLVIGKSANSACIRLLLFPLLEYKQSHHTLVMEAVSLHDDLSLPFFYALTEYLLPELSWIL